MRHRRLLTGRVRPYSAAAAALPVAGLALILLLAGAAVSLAALETPVEPDLRTIPWPHIERLVLLAGEFPPLYQPVSLAELERLPGLPPTVRAAGPAGRLLLGYTELGHPLTGEAGLAWAPGWNAGCEVGFAAACGRWWAAASPRLHGRVAAAGVRFAEEGGAADPLTWPGWPAATGMSAVHEARLKGGVWNLDLPYAVAGARFGSWNLTAGYAPRRTGPGSFGSLLLDPSGESVPALTLRRNRPFIWRRFMAPLAPDAVLLRLGRLTERKVAFRNDWGLQVWRARPWFFQWLSSWEVTPWFRFSAQHAAMAAADDGTLWPDLPPINFPLLGTTVREVATGPVTDRLFAARLDFRWRAAPWPLLPAAAGRLYWEYAGTDFLPSGPGGHWPQISAPASVAGVEFLDPDWDVLVEYAELEHPRVMWYSNGGFVEGYTQSGRLLGHPIGGTAESIAGRVRWRLRGGRREWSLRLSRTTRGMFHRTPGTGREVLVALGCGGSPLNRDGRLRLDRTSWEITVEWRREEADRTAFLPGPAARPVQRDWWRIICRLPVSW